jgi:predicted Fe-Mo cluster-binding NifX family protein
MKIAISSFGPNLTSQLCPRLGGCKYFLVIDPEDMNLEVFENKHDASTSGAGRRAAQFLVSQKVHAVITGRCRPNTFKVLSEAGVYLYFKHSGTVKEVLEKYRNGHLRRATRVDLDSRISPAAANKQPTN